MTDIRFLRVSINGLKIRATPAGDTTRENLRYGEIIEVDYDTRVERDGLIWVKHHEGWSAIRPVKLVTGQSAYVEDITHQVPENGVMFTVRYASLNVRQTPNGTPNEYVLMSNDIVIGEKRPDGQPDDGGHIWWKHSLGWTSERNNTTIYMNRIRDIYNSRANLTAPPQPLINPASNTSAQGVVEISLPDPNNTIDITDDNQFFYYRVIEEQGVNVRRLPDATADKVGFVDFGQVVTIKTEQARVLGNYRWHQLSNNNWIALGPKNVAIDWLEQIPKPEYFEPGIITQDNIHELPSWRALFTDFPVNFPPESDWFQYFGNTVFAFTHGYRYNYDGYSQGLHGGIDFGSNAESLDIYARVTGEVVKVIDRAGARNQIQVQSGPYLIIYLHLANQSSHDNTQFEVGQRVTPDTLIGKTLFGAGNPNHLHLEVRYKEDMIINPLELFPKTVSDQILARYNPATKTGSAGSYLRRFFKNARWERWTTPFNQPVIQLRGKIIGPKTIY